MMKMKIKCHKNALKMDTFKCPCTQVLITFNRGCCMQPRLKEPSQGGAAPCLIYISVAERMKCVAGYTFCKNVKKSLAFCFKEIDC
jgi:hypothetical protein